MLKIGVLTYFYNVDNYGAQLQAYALTKYLNSIENVSCEQILYDKLKCGALKKRNVFSLLRRCLGGVKRAIIKLKNVRYIVQAHNRVLLYRQFQDECVSHSSVVYNQKNMYKTNDLYDCFIVGSDQVWNPAWYDEVMLLTFVNKNKYKFSYAASVCAEKFDELQERIYKKDLSSFDAVSVRENSAVKLLSMVSSLSIEQVLDPTLLFSGDIYDQLKFQKIINEKYIYCYFLGENFDDRLIATEFAKKHDLKIATIPHIFKRYRKCDNGFGDILLKDIGPKEFISLIKHAEYVFTDSFHASVFSHIYKRNFFVFNRKGFKAMNDRIYSLTDLFDTGDRFCDSKEKCTLEYIESLPPINYDREFPKFEAMKEKSINFLKDNLKKCKYEQNTKNI